MSIRIWADNLFAGGTTIFWDTSLCDAGPYVYSLYVGRDSFEEWTLIKTVVDTIGAIDYERRMYGVHIDIYYKVMLQTADGTYESHPVRADGGLAKRDWLIAKEVVRKEHLSNVKGLGTKGYLLKRRGWGERCRECTDFSTGSVKNRNCYTCYGTGIIGGYYPPIVSWARFNTYSRQIALEPGAGHVDNKHMQARFVAYPYLTPMDVWVNADNDERFILGDVGPITVSASIRSKPLIQTIAMGLVPAGDILYAIPVGEGGSYRYPVFPESPEESSSSSSSSEEFPTSESPDEPQEPQLPPEAEWCLFEDINF